PEFFFWSHIVKSFFMPQIGHRCMFTIHPKAATIHEILEFAVERFAAFPVNKAILLQYPYNSFEGTASIEAIDQALMIRDAANRHGVPVIDTYYAVKNRPLHETYSYSDWGAHHSKRGNEIVADLIAREISVQANP